MSFALLDSVLPVTEAVGLAGSDFRTIFSLEGFRVAIPGVSKERRLIGIGIESGEFDRSMGDIGDS